jgi:pimeloyl-ACP methyl ester carboxylesterase
VGAGLEVLVSEQLADVGDIRLSYETFGAAADPPLLLVMGLATQMIAWPDEFCEALAARGFYVIRFDNRDIGRSTHLQGVRPPRVRELLTRRVKNPAYTLETMADDAAGLLEVLGLADAHVVGVSMGGMIGQTLAAHHPDRVRSLVSIMSTTGNRWKGTPAARVYPVLLAKPARTKDEYVAALLKVGRVIGSTGFVRDEDALRALAERMWERGHSPAGPGRQLAAIIASGDRTVALGRITAPTLVIHGTKDRLVRPSGGRATAAAIPGARLQMVEGMGHDLPRGAWPQIIDAVALHAAAADVAARGASAAA